MSTESILISPPPPGAPADTPSADLSAQRSVDYPDGPPLAGPLGTSPATSPAGCRELKYPDGPPPAGPLGTSLASGPAAPRSLEYPDGPPRAGPLGTSPATSPAGCRELGPGRAWPLPGVPKLPRVEPRSPFLAPTALEGPSLDELVDAQDGAPPLALILLSDPDAVVTRLQDPQRLEGLVAGALGVVAVSTALFAGALVGPYGVQAVLRASALATVSLLLGLAAALGPIYGTSVVMAARLPMGRLVGVLLAAVASGALLLPGLAPAVHFALRFDPEWWGPGAAVGSFGAMGLVTGLRLRRLLLSLAEAPGDLSPGGRFRVGVLTRMALAFTGLTVSLAFWAFDAFVVG
jgi:hypothetical protein